MCSRIFPRFSQPDILLQCNLRTVEIVTSSVAGIFVVLTLLPGTDFIAILADVIAWGADVVSGVGPAVIVRSPSLSWIITGPLILREMSVA